MQEQGLVEVENPSEYMLSGKPENASGSVVVCLMGRYASDAGGGTGTGL